MSVKARPGGIIVLIISLLILAASIYINVRDDDGLDEWKQAYGLYRIEVIYDGEKYYCEHAESPAGQPERLMLFRGENYYLMLPDKYAVKESQPLPNSGLVPIN